MKQTLIGTLTVADQTNMAFASTSITNGDMTGVVVATGDYTQIGKINKSINDVKQEKTPLIISINNLGKYISYAIVSELRVLLFGFGVLFDIYEIPTLLLSSSNDGSRLYSRRITCYNISNSCDRCSKYGTEKLDSKKSTIS